MNKIIGGLALAIVVALVAGSVAQAKPAATKVRAASASKKATTSFHFNDIPVRSALQLIAEEGDFNLVVSDSVTGNITLKLQDVTWEQALDVVLRLKGLGQRVDGDTRSVAPKRG